MVRNLLLILCLISLFSVVAFSQTNEWGTDYITLDASANGTGFQTASVAAVGPDNFVALVNEELDPAGFTIATLFEVQGNYLVGYWAADSVQGRVLSPINGQQTSPQYAVSAQFTDWEYILDQVRLKGAWQLAGDGSDRIYVANNDAAHNILVFSLNALGLFSSEFRMETGTENIYGIDLDDAGNVYVADFEGTAAKTNEVKVFAGIGAAGTTWGTTGAHNDSPISTVDLPDGYYQGLTVSSDGTELFVSQTSERKILKYVGDPNSGYTLDPSFDFTLAADDTIGNGGFGTPSVQGLAYMPDPPLLVAAVDTVVTNGSTFGETTGYPYGRVYFIHTGDATILDTIDVAEWNLAITGAYGAGSGTYGRAGGYTSILDVDVEASEQAIYSQSYYGWTAEKWLFDGDLNAFVRINPVSLQVPEGYNLKQNYPNPFNPLTTIEFAIEKTSQVQLDIINVMGQRVATVVDEQMNAGTYRVTFDAKHLPSGIYFYRIHAGDFTSIKKMTLMK
ncbi:MAG: T9SS type A sorting domain-containing protein [bacterium]|nr:MAG: T9SS type A sorting domain-containing protein [bacterium]